MLSNEEGATAVADCYWLMLLLRMLLWMLLWMLLRVLLRMQLRMLLQTLMHTATVTTDTTADTAAYCYCHYCYFVTDRLRWLLLTAWLLYYNTVAINTTLAWAYKRARVGKQRQQEKHAWWPNCSTKEKAMQIFRLECPVCQDHVCTDWMQCFCLTTLKCHDENVIQYA